MALIVVEQLLASIQVLATANALKASMKATVTLAVQESGAELSLHLQHCF